MSKLTRAMWTVPVLAICVIAVPGLAYAQGREGFWAGAGGGYGFAHASCDACDHTGRESSGVLYVKAGWTLTPRLILGSEFSTWSNDAVEIAPNLSAALRMSSVSAMASFYPLASTGLFIKGGVGTALVDMELTVGRASIASDVGSGLGLIAGAGYDIALTERVSVTPGVNFWFGRIGDLTVDSEIFVSDWKQNVFDITIGLTFH